MIFLTYWELNEDMPIAERNDVARSLTEKGLFPGDRVQVVRWDVTPDGWGILITEAETAEDVFTALNLWRASGDGFFRNTRTAPALPVQDAIGAQTAMLEKLGKS